MIIEVSVAVIAACFVLIVFRLYTLSMRVEETIKRIEEFLLRMETDIRPVLYDARDVMNDMKGLVETAKQSTKQVDYIIEEVASPVRKVGIFLKALRAGLNALLKKRKGGE